MRVISFKDTVLFKRGFWLAALALMAAVAAPSIFDRSIFTDPAVHVIPLCILGGFWIYFLQRGRFFSIADVVIDAGDSLKVKRGSTEVVVPFSTIISADARSQYGLQRISLDLRVQTKLGNRIDFWPQASLWGNAFKVQQLALDIAERAKIAAAIAR